MQIKSYISDTDHPESIASIYELNLPSQKPLVWNAIVLLLTKHFIDLNALISAFLAQVSEDSLKELVESAQNSPLAIIGQLDSKNMLIKYKNVTFNSKLAYAKCRQNFIFAIMAVECLKEIIVRSSDFNARAVTSFSTTQSLKQSMEGLRDVILYFQNNFYNFLLNYV